MATALAAALLVPAQHAKAFAGWDGESAASGSCAIGPPGDECRRQTLLKDAKQKADYKGSQKASGPLASGVPVADMSDEYVKVTGNLITAVVKYASMDMYDPQRPTIVKTLKEDGRRWTSAYARGGSARKLSARKLYIVIDALQGHITSNGFAPFPRNKMEKLLKDTDEAQGLLAQGR